MTRLAALVLSLCLAVVCACAEKRDRCGASREAMRASLVDYYLELDDAIIDEYQRAAALRERSVNSHRVVLDVARISVDADVACHSATWVADHRALDDNLPLLLERAERALEHRIPDVDLEVQSNARKAAGRIEKLIAGAPANADVDTELRDIAARLCALDHHAAERLASLDAALEERRASADHDIATLKRGIEVLRNQQSTVRRLMRAAQQSTTVEAMADFDGLDDLGRATYGAARDAHDELVAWCQ